MATRNPFIFGGKVKGDDFCGRKKELKEFSNCIESGQNTLLYASRRYGKSSLLEEVLIREKKRKGFYIDLFSVITQEAFTKAYFNAFMGSIKDTPAKLMQYIKSALNFSPSFSMTVDQGGNMNFSLEVSKKEKEAVLEEVINLPYKYAQKKKTKLFVVIDEFQEIASLNLEAQLRSYIQNHGREVAYIFSGSKKSILTQMFTDKSRPFYQSVKLFPLKGIPYKDWLSFIANKFEETGKEIDKSMIKDIVEITQGCPFHVQHLCHTLWDLTETKVTKELYEEAFLVVMDRARDSYWHDWDSLSAIQKKVALMISESPDSIYSKENLLQYELTPANIQRAITSLIDKNILERDADKIIFQDPFLRLWILSMKQKVAL